MRLFEIEQTPIEEAKLFIKRNCSEYLEQVDNNPAIWSLWRGIMTGFDADMVVRPIRKDRVSRDTDPDFHNLLIQAFNKAGLTANRDNSIFCTGSRNTARDYGNKLVHVMPIGPFDFSWSPTLYDLYGATGEEFEDKIGRDVTPEFKDQINSYIAKHYTDHDLKAAIISKHEIMIACEEVLLISIPFFKELYPYAPF